VRSADRDRVVILDLGNVVLDWNVDRILGSLDADSRERDLLREQLFEHRRWLDLDHGKISEAAVIAELDDRTPLSREIVESALEATRQSLEPIAESVSLMQQISDRGIEMFCLSNMSRETWNHVCKMELFDLFSGIVISAIEGCMKPGEEIFRLTLERFALRPRATLFIDDSAANVETSRRLGIEGFHFRRSPACYDEIRSRLFRIAPAASRAACFGEFPRVGK
jgi:HAD superfamily hydrolase (TIGR01509 family)